MTRDILITIITITTTATFPIQPGHVYSAGLILLVDRIDHVRTVPAVAQMATAGLGTTFAVMAASPTVTPQRNAGNMQNPLVNCVR